MRARFTLLADGDAVRVERRKLRYEAMASDELHPHVLAGQSQATLSRSLGWITGVDVDERMTLEIAELGIDVDVHAVFQFALQAQGTRALAPRSTLWDESWLAAAGHREDLTAGGVQYERDRWSKRLAGASLTSLTQALAALLAVEPQDAAAIDAAWQALVWLVKLRPEAATEIQQAVGGMESGLGDMLVSALGAAGTDPAQNVLASMRHDPALPAAVRTAATMALFQLAQPNERVLAGVAGDVTGAEDLTGDRAMAMLLLGALAPRAGDALIDGKTPLATLFAAESKAAQQDRLDLWLDALGNVGTSDVLPHAQRLTKNEQDSVRAAAYHALRRVDTPEAMALLVRGLDDPSASVRKDVVVALGEQRSPAASAALIRAARDDGDPAVRRAGQRALVRFANSDTPARQALAELAQTDPDPATRAAASELLRALRQGGGA